MARSDDQRPPLEPTDHVERAIRLLTWARAAGFRVGPTLQVGDVTMQVDDVRQRKQEGIGGEPQRMTGPYAEHGLDDDDVPAPGTAG